MLKLIKNKNIPEKVTHFNSRTIVIGDLLKKKKIESFDGLRKMVNSRMSVMREDWLTGVLLIHGVVIAKDGSTRRETQERLLESGIEIERVVNNEKGTDIDRVSKNGVVIGEWNNKRQISLDFDGRLCVTIEYYTRPSE